MENLNTNTKVKFDPIDLFHTPEDWKELNEWVMKHSDYQERMHIMTSVYMTWNLACKIVNDEDKPLPKTIKGVDPHIFSIDE